LSSGDVVICSQPSDVRDHVIKRVTALAGQDVAVFRPGSAVPTHITVRATHPHLLSYSHCIISHQSEHTHTTTTNNNNNTNTHLLQSPAAGFRGAQRSQLDGGPLLY
jgi:hypothetical protein